MISSLYKIILPFFWSCDKDPTIIHYTSGLQRGHRFSIEVFNFFLNHTFVYIHCDLRLCDKNVPGTVCAKSTACSSRKRRDVSLFNATDNTYQLSIGPFMYQKKTNEQGLSHYFSSSLFFQAHNSSEESLSIFHEDWKKIEDCFEIG